jgi:Spy/CpxP family protein refolding chaperone
MDIPQNRQQIARRSAVRAAPALFLMALFLLTPVSPLFAGDFAAPRLVDSEAATLNLSPVQQQKITALESASRAQSGVLIAQIHQLRHKLSDLYGTYAVDVAGARRMNQEMNRLQSQLLELRLTEQLQIRKILSPAQFSQLQTAIHKHDSSEDQHPDADDQRRHRRGDSH